MATVAEPARAVAAAWALLSQGRHGVLATCSARRAGWPFASITAYALDQRGEPLLLLSDLAEHTRNLEADPRASLLVQDPASLADPQAGGRLTLLGQVEALPLTDANTARARYLDRHPQAAAYFSLADFRLYVLRIAEARYVGGFGDMGWLDGPALLAASGA